MSDAASNQIITLGTTDKTYTFTFTNWVSAKKIKTSIMLGALMHSMITLAKMFQILLQK